MVVNLLMLLAQLILSAQYFIDLSRVVLSISYAGDPKGDVELTTYKVSLMLIVAATSVAVTNAAYVKVCTY